MLVLPRRLAREDIRSGERLGKDQARFLVQQYYDFQDMRKATALQLRALQERNEPQLIVEWVNATVSQVEQGLLRGLDAYTLNDDFGAWARSICGIGPVLAAALCVFITPLHVDPDRPLLDDGSPNYRQRTAGDVWRFAGLDPTVTWYSADQAQTLVHSFCPPGATLTLAHINALSEQINRPMERLVAFAQGGREPETMGETPPLRTPDLIRGLSMRPWNALFKRTAWLIGESFVYQSGREGDIYGKLIRERKAYETEKNDRGDYADQAIRYSRKFRLREGSSASVAYGQGKLPASHIHERAKRWGVKLFLSHAHHVAWEIAHGEPPPVPYAIRGGQGRIGYIPPPNWPMGQQ